MDIPPHFQPSAAREVQLRLAAAIHLARDAGQTCLSYFRGTAYLLDEKPDGSPVTTADRESERLINQGVQTTFATDGFLGEEYGERFGTSGYRWVVDPIDGTASFIHGVPLFGTLIGIEHRGRAVAGVIHMPALNEMVYASDGHGAWHVTAGADPVPARVSRIDTLRDALVCITSFDYFTKAAREREFHALARACASLRGWSDCYAHVLVATGRVEAVVEPRVHPWDLAATIPIIREAGGRFTDFAGLETAYSGDAIATNGLVHSDLLRAITGDEANPAR